MSRQRRVYRVVGEITLEYDDTIISKEILDTDMRDTADYWFTLAPCDGIYGVVGCSGEVEVEDITNQEGWVE